MAIDEICEDSGAQPLRELENRQRQIDALKRVSEALFAHLAVDDLIRDVLKVAVEVLDADVGSLLLYDPGTDRLVFRFVNDPSAAVLTGHGMPASEGIAGHVFRTGVADLTSSAEERPEFYQEIDRLTGYRTQSMLTAPLRRFGGQPIGVVQVLNAQRHFDRHDLEVFEVLCAHAATSIETARLAEEARVAQVVNLVGDISHDINNLLTPVKSSIYALQLVLERLQGKIAETTSSTDAASGRELVDAAETARKEYSWILRTAEDCIDKVTGRTRELADAVKGEIAPPVLELAPINETARAVAGTLELQAKVLQVQLRLDLDDALPDVQCDRQQIFNALYNLVNNALAETPPHGYVCIRTHSPTARDPRVLLEVEDTGRGMSDEVRAHLFTDAAISTKVGGTGLGTRIVAGVVRRHTGELKLRTALGEGTTISMLLPLKQPG